MLRSFKLAGRDDSSWPVLGLLLVVVLVPTLGVLWFMGQAMQNERLAVRQKLREVYQARLLEARDALGATWRARLAALDATPADGSAQRRFAEHIRAGDVDAALFFDDDGALLYPVEASSAAPVVTPSGQWRRAERLERAGQLDGSAADPAMWS